jgi:hypothetical protein
MGLVPYLVQVAPNLHSSQSMVFSAAAGNSTGLNLMVGFYKFVSGLSFMMCLGGKNNIP